MLIKILILHICGSGIIVYSCRSSSDAEFCSVFDDDSK